MSYKKDFNDVTTQLAEQAKQRFSLSIGNSDINEEIVEIKNKKESKKQKTIYLTQTMFKLLKKASYIKTDLDQSEIVAIALERYFESEGIRLLDGE